MKAPNRFERRIGVAFLQGISLGALLCGWYSVGMLLLCGVVLLVCFDREDYHA